MSQGIGRSGGEFAGDALNGTGRNPGNGSRPFRSVLSKRGSQFIEARGIAGNKLLVEQVFPDDDIQQRQVESQIGARANRQPLRGLGSGLGKTGVERNYFGAAVDGLAQSRRFGGGDGLHQVAAGEDNIFQAIILAVGLFHAVRDQVGDDHGVEAQAALGAIIGGAVRVQEIFKLNLGKIVGGRKDHRLGAIFLLDSLHFIGYKVESFFPGSFAEEAFATLADPDQGSQNTIRVVGVHQARLAARAELAIRMGMFRITFQLDHPAIFNPGQQATAPDAHLAHTGNVASVRRIQ